MVFIDNLILFFNAYLFLTIGNTNFENYEFLSAFVFLLIGSCVYILTGQYRALIRYFSKKLFYHIALRNLLVILIFCTYKYFFFGIILYPIHVINCWFVLTSIVYFVRLLLSDFLLNHLKNLKKSSIANVAIYGAGSAGAQLAASINFNSSHHIVTFFDDDPSLWNRSINGIKIQSPDLIKRNINKIDQILMAIPSAGVESIKKICQTISSEFQIPIYQIPTINDLTSGRAEINNLTPIAIEDLLGRDSVKPKNNLLGPGIAGSNVLITGAGGQ